MERKSIPTWYAGNKFRSRLEARWAAFFDELGWEWIYEPLDLDGYIPDFVLTNFKRGPLLVEVKPRISEAAKRKIERSGWDKDALIVGAYPVISAERYECGAYIGDLTQRGGEGERGWAWDEGLISCASFNDGSLDPVCLDGCGLQHSTASYACYRCGGYDGNLGEGPSDLKERWGRASAKVQWAPSEPPPRSGSAPATPCAKCGTPVDGHNIGGHSGRPDRKLYCQPCAQGPGL